MEPFVKLRAELHRLLPTDIAMESVGVETKVDEVRRRLQVPIPPMLIDFHRVFGHSSRLYEAINHIVALDDLYIESKGLVVVEELQRFYIWGVRLADLERPDVPVVQLGRDEGEQEWFPYGDSLECFMANEICWQAMNLMTMATAKCTASLLARLSESMRPISKMHPTCSVSEDTLSFVGDEVLCVAYPAQGIVAHGPRPRTSPSSCPIAGSPTTPS